MIFEFVTNGQTDVLSPLQKLVFICIASYNTSQYIYHFEDEETLMNLG